MGLKISSGVEPLTGNSHTESRLSIAVSYGYLLIQSKNVMLPTHLLMLRIHPVMIIIRPWLLLLTNREII